MSEFEAMGMNSVLRDDQTIDNIADDVLVEIFSYIDGEELLSMQTVCIKWDRVINRLINWKHCLERKVRCCPIWRGVWNSYAISSTKTSSSYKARFKDMHRTIRKMDRNWRRGKFSEMDVDISGERYEDADDDFLVHSRDKTIVVYDRKKMRVAHNISGFDTIGIHMRENLLFLTEKNRGFVVFDVKTGRKFQIAKHEECEFISYVAVNTKTIAIVYRGPWYTCPNSMLQLWQRKNDGFQLLSEQIFKDRELRVDMDDCYMALYEGLSGQRFCNGYVRHFNIHFSRNSRVERTMSVPVRDTSFLYSQGFFYLFHKRGEIRIMEVSTGQWIRTIQHPRWTWFSNVCEFIWWSPAAANSKYLATMDTTERPDRSMESTVRIFDLVAARDPTCHHDNFHLATISLTGFRFSHVKINERELYGQGEFRRSGGRFFKSVDFLGKGSGREVISNITHRRAVRKPTRFGQGDVSKGNI